MWPRFGIWVWTDDLPGHFATVEPNEAERVHPDELAETLYAVATSDTEVEHAA